MDLPILSAAAASLIAVLLAPPAGPGPSDLETMSAAAAGPGALVGETLWASEDPIDRWGDPVRPEELRLDGLGPVARVVTDADGAPQAVVVALGGLWGLGAEEVTLGLERVHLLRAADGTPRLVVDLSADGAAPAPDGLDL